jgi:uncharacterized membrane protein YbhN (UPF0104 family)
MVVVIRAGLISNHKIRPGMAAASVFLETLTMMTVGAAISAAILAMVFRDQALLFWLAVILALVAGLPTLPPIFKRLVRLVPMGRSDPKTMEMLERLNYRHHLFGWFTMALGWCLMGLSLWAVLKAMGIEGINPLTDLPRYTACVALAMVSGFLSLVPGGAVVRELVLTQLLVPHLWEVAPFIGVEAAALVAAVAIRLVWLLSELIISGLLFLKRPRVLEVP